ncbi:MAG: choice-of-anchor I family protein, partial [Cytophagales bacterium]
MKKTLFGLIGLFAVLSSFAQLRMSVHSGSAPLGFSVDGGVAEITAYDPITKQLFCINGQANQIAVYDFSVPTFGSTFSPSASFSISGAGFINSIACKNGVLAVVYENAADRTQNGFVQLFTTSGLSAIGSAISVGAQPDMITFTPDGQKILVANEGEPNDSYTVDPEGSVTIITITNPTAPTTQQVSLTSLNGTIPHLSTQPSVMPSIRIFGMINSETVSGTSATNTKTPSTVAQDIEPEYITISPDGNTAWVACQENNALLVINIPSATLTTIVGLGYKDHNVVGKGLDASRTPTNTNSVDIKPWKFKGMYQPDGISVYTIGGIPYIFSANEGDARAYSGFNEELDVNAAFGTRMNSANFTASEIAAITATGIRLTSTMGNTNGGLPFYQNSVVGQNINLGNNFEELYTFGARSYSIWNGNTGALVWDSGDQIEKKTLELFPLDFNKDHNGNNNIRRRSTSKGPEPESIVTGMIGDSIYAFVGLERIGGVMAFNVSNPNAPYFVQYINNRNFANAPTAAFSATGSDLGPEGLTLINAAHSPDGNTYLVISNEVSGTLRVVQLNYNQNLAKNMLKPFIIDANQTESAVQILTLGGNNFTSPILVAASGDFRTSLTPVGSFAVGTQITFSGNSFQTVVYVKYLGTDPFQKATLSFTDNNAVQASVINVNGINTITTTGAAAYTLQILHGSDFEAGLAALDNAPKFVAIWNKFNGDYANTLRLSGGDNYIPSPFFNASADAALRPTFSNVNRAFYGTIVGTNIREGIGRADINILNMLDLHASAIGNHEFDAGTGTFLEIINVAYDNVTNPTQVRWLGTRFPYLSANLDFSADINLSGLYTSEIRPVNSYRLNPLTTSVLSLTAEQRKKIAPAAIVTIGGEAIGLVGGTTQIVEKISSTGGVQVIGTDVDDMPLLASQLQPVIDNLRNRGINKIVVMSHLQQLTFEKQLAPLLNGVDIVLAAGSHTLLADSDDDLEGATKKDDYPLVATGKDGGKTIIICTENEYQYVGRLVIDFDANGNVIPASYVTSISGAWKASDAGMVKAGVDIATAFSGTNPAYLTKGLIDGINIPNGITISGVVATSPGIRTIINSQDGNVFGKTNVFIEGRREQVRLQETNLGNLSADANLAEARKLYPDVMISIKNGGGIRAAIGVVSAVGGDFILSPPLANPSAGKLTGDISQLDILNSLRFNNSLSVGQISATNLLAVLNHAVAASGPGATPGQFAQVGGIRYSWNPSLAAGSRVRSAAIVDQMGNVIDALVDNGVVVGDPARLFRMVTLNFMVGTGGAGAVGGDNYPLNTATFLNRVDLGSGVTTNGYNTVTGAATFGAVGGEQDAFAKFMRSNYSTTGYNVNDTPVAQDLRIQNLTARSESIFFSMPLATFAGLVNQTVSMSSVSITGSLPAEVITITAPVNVSIDGLAIKTILGTGGTVSISSLLPASVGLSFFNITLSSLLINRIYTHTISTSNPPSITFNGFSLTVGGADVDLSNIFITNSNGVKSFTANGAGANLNGSILTAVNAGTVTITGTVGSTSGFDLGKRDILVNVSNRNPSITFSVASITVGGANIDLATLFNTNSTGLKSFSITSGIAASISGNNLVALGAGNVTVSGMVASTLGFNAGSATAVFNILNANPSITFNGFNMTVDGLNVDLSALFTSNSSGTKTFAVSGTAAVLVGQSTLSAVSAGTVTITGMVSSTTGFNAGMANAIVNVI